MICVLLFLLFYFFLNKRKLNVKEKKEIEKFRRYAFILVLVEFCCYLSEQKQKQKINLMLKLQSL